MSIRKIGIIGTGLMGTGIARCAALNGFEVTLVKWTAGDPEAARRRFESALDKDVARKKLTEDDAAGIKRRIVWTMSFEPLAACDLIIESVIEDEEVKLSVFKLMDRVAKPDAILATNTSTLLIEDLAAATRRTERVFGLHFFNPVDRMKLVELVVADGTDIAARGDLIEFADALGKTPIVVRSSPGFVVNRALMAFLLENVRMISEPPPVAAILGIDRAIELGLGHPMGPFRLMDLIGLDVVLAMSESLCEGLGQRYAPPRLLERMVDEGFLGRKAGIGFYVYAGPEDPLPNAKIADLLTAS